MNSSLLPRNFLAIKFLVEKEKAAFMYMYLSYSKGIKI